MTKIIESSVENFAIDLLEKQGYKYIYGPTIAPDSDTPRRSSFEDVLLLDHLRTAIAGLNLRSLRYSRRRDQTAPANIIARTYC
jgi:type I restriction enzyme R subunit